MDGERDKDWRRIRAINDTKIQYLSVADKIYKVTHIDFCNLAIETTETGLSIDNIPENEVFPVEEFGEFRIRLINGVWCFASKWTQSALLSMKLLFQYFSILASYRLLIITWIKVLGVISRFLDIGGEV